jgi:Polyphosphate kinase 2 (PPK2)
MLKLCRLRYIGSARQWQFAVYRASRDDYDEAIFPTGLPMPRVEKAMADDGIVLLKYWLEVSLGEQTRRLQSRINKRRGRLNIISHLLSQVPYKPLAHRDIALPTRQRADGYVQPDVPLRYIPTPF